MGQLWLRIIAVSAALGLNVPATQADIVHLINGDRMAGEINTPYTPSGLDFRVSSGHVFNIPWSNVAGLYDGKNNALSLPAFDAANTPPPLSARPLSADINTNAPIPITPQGLTPAPDGVTAPAQIANNAQTVQDAPIVATAPAYDPEFYYAPRLGTSRRPALPQWPSYDEIQAANAISPTSGDQDETPAAAPDAGWLGAVWKGRANIGASLQRGNTDNSAVAADIELKAKWQDIHRASVRLDYNREEDDGDVTEDNRKLSLLYDYFFADHWFLNTTASFEQDDIDQIDLRTTAGVGLGHQVYEGDALNLQYVLGPTYLRTEFENGETEDSLAGRWALDYDQYVLDELFQVFHDHEFILPSNDTEAFLFNSKTGVRLPIRRGITATAEVDFDWDNDPQPGVVEDDTTYAVKIGYEW